jgi:hypothetical protein
MPTKPVLADFTVSKNKFAALRANETGSLVVAPPLGTVAAASVGRITTPRGKKG